MNLKRPPRHPHHRPEHRHPERGLALLDTLLDSYVAWRDESRAVRDSYRQWHTAGREERREAFERYLEALDREEQAALGYRRIVEQANA